MGLVRPFYCHNFPVLLVPSIGFPICARFSSSSETSEYGLDVSDDRLISRIMMLGVPASTSFSLRFLSPGFLPSSVSSIISVPWRGAISEPRFLILILTRSLILVLQRSLILPGLALIICYKTEKFLVLDELLNQDSEISALVGKVASGIVKCVELVFILLSHVCIVEGTRLLVLWVSLDFH
jgi:hypothetical protein